MTGALSCELVDDVVCVHKDLRISFQRTIRVPDNGQQVSYLPPSLGKFPLQKVSQHATKMTEAMVAKGGLFFPMHQSEAMWINFRCLSKLQYHIKVYVGGVNAMSGEPAIETNATRQEQLQRGDRTLQDYLVVPKQNWLDGIADSDGTVRQFVAMPFGSGHSVEMQVTGQDAAGGIQIEVTPRKPYRHLARKLLGPGDISIQVKTLTGKIIPLLVFQEETVEDVKVRLQHKEGIPPELQALIFARQQLEGQYGDEMHLILTLRRGGTGPLPREMSIAAGGKIKQAIHADTYSNEWLSDRTTVFNVQILNSAAYKVVTGNPPPSKPICAQTYAENGMPFFAIYEEPSGISGDFGMVKSVAQIDGIEEKNVNPGIH
ncbi:uncharacterized protein N0V89_010093 [Didymosphaeria variabile]|uniref:Ubiquitin-like domain-containing protein n=1 Tax=Didymosphaeria variabile TaxID=1932322 RepID=A0A9W8XF20_9PLEO|nr:uncharacterized protein N0V89_010093 [Didymosphaeria variabile]KAJ4348715.1 hypothetical protein N0V89_010093 [Didymosphaeria variabile]